MKIKYDSKVDAIYIELAKGKYNKTRKVSPDVLVDEDRKGKVLGVEILEVRKNVPAFDPCKTNFEMRII